MRPSRCSGASPPQEAPAWTCGPWESSAGSRKPQVSAGGDNEPDDLLSGEGNPDDDSVQRIDLTRTYSAQEVLRQKDFADFNGREMAEAQRMMAALQWDLGRRLTRRMVPGDGGQLDLRRTVRRNLKYGGELLELASKKPKARPRSLVLICDVSGSMERYTRMFLHFIHTIALGQERLEAFLFATRLTRITRHLRYRSIDQAIDEVARAVPDWAGGTRIGEAVKTFNYQWLRRVLRGQSVVLIISDGWDRGDPELLSRETSRLQRSCHRLIWLNPLLGSPDYQPLTVGMQAALPYVDDFPAGTQPDQSGSLGQPPEFPEPAARNSRPLPAAPARRRAGKTGTASRGPAHRPDPAAPDLPAPAVGQETASAVTRDLTFLTALLRPPYGPSQ